VENLSPFLSRIGEKKSSSSALSKKGGDRERKNTGITKKNRIDLRRYEGEEKEKRLLHQIPEREGGEREGCAFWGGGEKA